MNENNLMGLIFGIGLPLIIFGFIALMRYINFRETLALAEKGLVRPAKAQSNGKNGDGKNTLRWGIVIASIGLAVIIGVLPIGGPVLLVGLIPAFFGLGLVLIYVLTRDSDKDK
jgi:Flp pilus assembly protein TadB